jgi:hypothetical protein
MCRMYSLVASIRLSVSSISIIANNIVDRDNEFMDEVCVFGIRRCVSFQVWDAFLSCRST